MPSWFSSESSRTRDGADDSPNVSVVSDPSLISGRDRWESGRPTLYTFTPTAGSAVTLLPPPGAPADVPRFHIVITQNVFNPLVHRTTVYRGEAEGRSVVGCFEMGLSNLPAHVRIHGRDTPIKTMLDKFGFRDSGDYTWTPPYRPTSHLVWDYGSTPITCKSKNPQTGKIVLATYTPDKWLTEPKEGGSVEEEMSLSILEVSPAGQELIEDVLISLLICERKRMAPGKDSYTKALFN